MRKEIADRDPALAVLPESEGRWKGYTGLPLRLKVFIGQHLARPARQLRLGIKCVHLRHAAIEKHMDDPPGGGGKMRDKGYVSSQGRLADQICEGQRAEAHAATRQEVAP